MSAEVASSILIVHPQKAKVAQFGADFAENFSAAKSYGTSYRVIVFPYKEDLEGDWFDFIKHLDESMPQAERIIVSSVTDPKKIQTIVNTGRAFRVVHDFTNKDFESTVQKALIQYAEKQQENDLAQLTQSENENLKQLSQELERLVEKKEKNLQRAQKRMLTMSKQAETLHHALNAVHQANSVSEVEVLLYEALKETFSLDWVRIFFHTIDQIESQLEKMPKLNTLKVPLSVGPKGLGQIIFARSGGKSFNRQEDDFLHQIAEGVSMAIDRLTKLEQAENLKHQWESTFDAISEPLCLTDENFKIIRTNSAFSTATGLGFTKLIGMNCFEAFSEKTSPTKLVPSENSFKIQKRPSSKDTVPQTFEVTTQKIQTKSHGPDILLIFFRNITEQEKFEKQIFQSAKMAELGTISSSIAHELNNPLGGILSFIQLILMDLKKDNELRDDILEMEKAGKRCKEIIENLLGFSRRQESSEKTEVDLREVVLQALKIVELQTRSLGIEVEVSLTPGAAHIKGQANLLAQAISHIFQNAYEAVSEKLTESPRFKGHIKVELLKSDTQYFINIKDNGVGITPELQSKIFNPLFSTKGSKRNPGLGLTLAYQIINEHGGRVEISSQPKIGTSVKISLSNV